MRTSGADTVASDEKQKPDTEREDGPLRDCAGCGRLGHYRATSKGAHGRPFSLEVPALQGGNEERLMGFEPTTFCMASRAWGYADCLDIPANERIHGREQLAAIPDFHREITGVWGLKAD